MTEQARRAHRSESNAYTGTYYSGRRMGSYEGRTMTDPRHITIVDPDAEGIVGYSEIDKDGMETVTIVEPPYASIWEHVACFNAVSQTMRIES